MMIVDWSMLPLLGMLGGSIIRRDFFFLSVFGFNGAFCSNLLCLDGLIILVSFMRYLPIY
jgi:hypothetical protein